MTDRVVLAYSGGLDTSVAIGWIAAETGAEVVAVAADVGQGGEDLEVIRQRALDCGAVEAVVADVRDEYADEFCLPALQANALYMGRYPLVSALSRPLIVKHLVAAAREHGASTVAHGCTGKGNDQVRFEVGIGALAPELRCIAPVRDSGMTRDKAIAFAEERGLPIDVNKKSPYSVDQNVWGRAVETGFLEDPWNAPIEDVYSYTSAPGTAARAGRAGPDLRRGRADRDRRPPGDACCRRSRSSTGGPAPRASGGSTWSRTAWSASRAARSTRCRARRCSSPRTRRWRTSPSSATWPASSAPSSSAGPSWSTRACGTARSSARWTSSSRSSQQHVSGEVRLVLAHGTCTVTGRRSQASLYDFDLATYDAGDTFDQTLAKGFVELWGMPSKLAAARDIRLQG